MADQFRPWKGQNFVRRIVNRASTFPRGLGKQESWRCWLLPDEIALIGDTETLRPPQVPPTPAQLEGARREYEAAVARGDYTPAAEREPCLHHFLREPEAAWPLHTCTTCGLRVDDANFILTPEVH